MSLRMVMELRSALDAAETGGSVRAVVLRGAGGHFCAGGDLKDMAGGPYARHAGDTVARRRCASERRPCGRGQRPLRQAWRVAYANTPLAAGGGAEGTVMGGGFGLACVADVALAGTSVAFRLPETSLVSYRPRSHPFWSSVWVIRRPSAWR